MKSPLGIGWGEEELPGNITLSGLCSLFFVSWGFFVGGFFGFAFFFFSCLRYGFPI